MTRIVPREGTIWIETKGDANADVDPSITSTEHVIGRVSATIPYAGFLLALLSAPSGVLFVVLLAAVLLTLIWLLESFEVDLVARAPSTVGPGMPLVAPAPAGGTPLAHRRRAHAERAGHPPAPRTPGRDGSARHGRLRPTWPPPACYR